MIKATNNFFCVELEKGLKIWAYISLLLSTIGVIACFLLYHDVFQGFIAMHRIISGAALWVSVFFLSVEFLASGLILVSINKVSMRKKK